MSNFESVKFTDNAGGGYFYNQLTTNHVTHLVAHTLAKSGSDLEMFPGF